MIPGETSFWKYFLTAAFALTMLVGCVAVETSPTLNEARSGKPGASLASDVDLRAGELRAEVLQVTPAAREVRVRTYDGRDRVLTYDPVRTKVTYHGWDYTVGNLEAGDIIAFRTFPSDSNYLETVRVQEPVQARTGATIARPLSAPPARSNVVEGSVERIQYDMGVFDVRTRNGDLVTVSIPYRANTADIDNFRRLRTGDYVRVEGSFVNRDNLQLYSFLSPR
jgi:translation initiation factor IF-1